jgi:hypothetical protein
MAIHLRQYMLRTDRRWRYACRRYYVAGTDLSN